ncbi:MAG: NAD(P)/FAD-dependent oxidoreductase [Myxococcota bacterium]
MREHYDYVVIGGGMTGHAAVRGIRGVDARGSVLVVSAEPHAPYQRPPLSKALWKGMQESGIWLGTDRQPGVELLRNTRASALRCASRVVRIGERDVGYGKLLLATGARPRRLPVPDDEGVIAFRTYDDYRRLAHLVRDKHEIVLVGGGYIGLELATALLEKGKDVTMIVRDARLGGRRLPAAICERIEAQAYRLGLELLREDEVVEVRRSGERFHVRTKRGRSVDADGVVSGIGVEPNVELAAGAGLHVRDGIVVDEQLRSSNAHVWAAGDVASAPVPTFGRIRQETEQNASFGGLLAGRNMAGAGQIYDDLPFVYSEFMDGVMEAVGLCEAQADVVAVPGSSGESGVFCYVRDERVRGVLFWNAECAQEEAEAMIRGTVVDDVRSYRPLLPLRPAA